MLFGHSVKTNSKTTQQMFSKIFFSIKKCLLYVEQDKGICGKLISEK